MSGKKGKSRTGRPRRIARCGGVLLIVLFAIHATVATWFVHHPREWLREWKESLPACVFDALMSVGNPIGDLTDALDLTGDDAVYEYDMPAPAGAVCFAGVPKRTGDPAPDDIVILDRGEFKIGWSPRLHHPVWCAYHVVRQAPYPTSRKNFQRDRDVPSAPLPGEYKSSGYDRGHMTPNHAIVTRYGEKAQQKTFLMSNIAPQSPALNRGVWRDLEHRIAELWTARYGEIWVIVGCVPAKSFKTFGSRRIDVPEYFYQLVVAQEGLDVRAFATLFPQTVSYRDYAARHLITIDELETITGLDFLSELPEFIQSPLEAELPTRLWPIRAIDTFKLVKMHFSN